MAKRWGHTGLTLRRDGINRYRVYREKRLVGALGVKRCGGYYIRPVGGEVAGPFGTQTAAVEELDRQDRSGTA